MAETSPAAWGLVHTSVPEMTRRLDYVNDSLLIVDKWRTTWSSDSIFVTKLCGSIHDIGRPAVTYNGSLGLSGHLSMNYGRLHSEAKNWTVRLSIGRSRHIRARYSRGLLDDYDPANGAFFYMNNGQGLRIWAHGGKVYRIFVVNTISGGLRKMNSDWAGGTLIRYSYDANDRPVNSCASLVRHKKIEMKIDPEYLELVVGAVGALFSDPYSMSGHIDQALVDLLVTCSELLRAKIPGPS